MPRAWMHIVTGVCLVVLMMYPVLAEDEAGREEETLSESAAEAPEGLGNNPLLPDSTGILTMDEILKATKALTHELFRATVVAAVSGNVLYVERNDTATEIRLYGVDCPEADQSRSDAARVYVIERFLNEDVDIYTLTTDSDGLAVALVVNADGDSLNHLLAADGLSWWDRQNAPKDVLMKRLNAEAIIAERGLYADPTALAPWDFREVHGLPQFSYSIDPGEDDKRAVASEAAPEEPVSISARGNIPLDQMRRVAPPPPPQTLPDIGKDVDPMELVIQHAPRIVQDESGRPMGLTASNVAGIPFATQLGFREGDIVSRVNGIQIESEAQIMSLIPQFRNVKQFNVEVLRNGQRTTIPINLP